MVQISRGGDPGEVRGMKFELWLEVSCGGAYRDFATDSRNEMVCHVAARVQETPDPEEVRLYLLERGQVMAEWTPSDGEWAWVGVA